MGGGGGGGGGGRGERSDRCRKKHYNKNVLSPLVT